MRFGGVAWYFTFLALVLACCIGGLWLVRVSALAELFHLSAALVFMAGALVIFQGLECALSSVDAKRRPKAGGIKC
jgi:hypothetical protein